MFEKRWWARNLNINLKGSYKTISLYDQEKLDSISHVWEKTYVFLFPIFGEKKNPVASQSFFVRAVHGRSIPAKMWRCLQIKRPKVPDGSNKRWHHLMGVRVPKFRDGTKFDMYIYIYING